MSFINQFPYSDFHELNIDWLLSEAKKLRVNVDYLNEEFTKIKILTVDEINSLIDSAIASNNIVLYNRMIELKNQITSEYQAYVVNQINQLKTYVDNQDVYYDGLAKSYADNTLVLANQYTDSKILNVTMMVNPITGEYDDVRNVVNDIVLYFHTENTLTAGEYDALDLTAQGYDSYDLSAYDYDYNGKILLV